VVHAVRRAAESGTSNLGDAAGTSEAGFAASPLLSLPNRPEDVGSAAEDTAADVAAELIPASAWVR